MSAPDNIIAAFAAGLEQTTPNDKRIRLTRFTSMSPASVTKTLTLNADGELVKVTPPQMSRGHADVLELEDITELAALLPTLTPAQALCYGIPAAPGNRFEVFSRKSLPADHAPHQITRTKDAFSWPAGKGVMMLDHDSRDGAPVLTREQLLHELEKAVPALKSVTRIWYPSASSCIYNGDAELAGIRGQRIYLVAKEAADVERAGKVLEARLWLAGHGWYDISKSGALLPRTLVDGSVWQQNRLDFAAGANCKPPLEQRRGDPLLISGDALELDTREAFPDLTAAELETLEAIQQEEKAAVAAAADEVRREFVVTLANKIAGGDPEHFAAARITAERAVFDQRLMGDYPLVLDDGLMLTVGDVLDDREKYHGRLTLDPLENDYDGGRVVGKLFLVGGRPTLHSFAHGGRTFKLIRAPRRVEAVTGKTSELIDRVLEVLRTAPDLFDLGDMAATIEVGRVVVLTDATLSYYVGHELQVWQWKKPPGGGRPYEADLDPPPKAIKAMLDMGRARRLRPLEAIITAPTLRRDGSVLNQAGYDKSTRLFFDPCGHTVPAVPLHPTPQQTADALVRLMNPFESFPFVSELDKSVLLAALITAAVRPALPTAPGVAFDAPIQGSGKTLLARCVGILAGGAEPSIWPHVTAARDAEAEIRKRLMTALLKGDAALLWDNVLGQFDSASIAAFLTAPTFTDRVLGQSRDATVPNRALFLATGNNVQLAGDLPRRFLTCRIDPATDRPFARRFALDPAGHCLKHRQQMVADALTLVRAWLSSEEQELGLTAPGATASFEDWDALVRQTVAWLALRDPSSWRDPMESIAAAAAADPEAEQLRGLLDALHRAFGSAPYFTAGDVRRHILTFDDVNHENSLSAAIEDILNRRDPSSKSIGRALMNRKDRRAGDRHLVHLGSDAINGHRWAVR